jgi:MFS transporter, ACS family, phthalate transporter
MTSQTLLGDVEAPTPLETPAEAALFHRLIWRIVPLLALCWMVNWIDRINIGFARIGFQTSLGISDVEFGLIVGIYSVGYLLLEVPSNLLMQRIGARKTLTRIMLLWGLITIAMAFARTSTEFVVARLALGAAEAGFFPGALLYLSYWFPARYRARVTARFIIANAVAGIVGAPLSGWLLSEMGGIWHLEAWQWLFIVEGLPPIALAGAVWFWLSDRPHDARWLTSAEQQTVSRALANDDAALAAGRHTGFRQALVDRRVYLLAVAFCCTIMCTGNVVQIWAPSILVDAGVGNVMRVGWLAAIPWAAGVVAMLVVSWQSDRHRERRWHFVAMGLIIATSLLALPSMAHDAVLALIGLSVMTGAYLAAIAIFWTIPSLYLSPPARAGGIALVNTLGQLGGLLTPLLIGWGKSQTGDLRIGLSVVGAVVVLGVLSIAISFPRRVLDGVGHT